jgi:hypothetical protein
LKNPILQSFASTPGGVRTCNGAAFAYLKKYAPHFFNTAYSGTEPKEAPNAGTDRSRRTFLLEVQKKFQL